MTCDDMPDVEQPKRMCPFLTIGLLAGAKVPANAFRECEEEGCIAWTKRGCAFVLALQHWFPLFTLYGPDGQPPEPKVNRNNQ